MNNKQLTAADRSKMEILLQQEYTLTDIANALGFHKSTISREFNRRKTPNGYFSKYAQLDYEDKREACGKSKVLNNHGLRDQVIYLLKLG